MAKKKKKKKKNKNRADLDVRPFPNPMFKNYDYADSPTGPGVGLYHGPMNRYKSVREFIEKSRKRLKAYYEIEQRLKNG